VTLLSRGSILAMARESVSGTYLAPTFTIPFTAASYDTVYTPLWDQSIRNNDAVKQGLYQGPGDSTWDMTFHAYPDIAGNFLRMVGTDTVTAATATTLSSSSIATATSISTVATIPAGSTIRIDTAANIEYAVTGTPTGVGPFAIPLLTSVGGPSLALTLPHSSGVAVTTTTTHTFKQNVPATRPPSWSISTYEGVDYRGWAGCQMSELAIKIDPKATITFQAKFAGFPEASVSSFVYAGSTIQPNLGWGWNMTNAGGASTRGLTYDLTLKRATDAIHSSDGIQAPREVFPGALELDGAYKAIFENTTDYNLYINNTQSVTTATLAKAISFGGESLAITMSQSGWSKGTRNLSGTYVDATFSLSGIYNATDSGIGQIILKNFTTASY
jgi:hypothetical protein